VILDPGLEAALKKFLTRNEQEARLYGADLTLDMSLLTERARLNGFGAPTHISSNGTCRLIETRGGWIAVNLARSEDVEVVPAWAGLFGVMDPWDAIRHAAKKANAATLVESGQLLGIPVAPAYIGTRPDDLQFRGEAIKRTRITPGLCRATRTPLVIDLSSLWAGPLCGHLLALSGARVIKIESTQRPDGARFGSPAFSDSLNGKKEQVSLDFKSEADKQMLWNWIEQADVVIESARPRAMQQMGFLLPDIFARNPFLTWVSITAYGREGPWSNYVGFGDDAAAAGSLLSYPADGPPNFCGDAIADPLAGVAAATAALKALSEGGGLLLDVSLREVAASIVHGSRVEHNDGTR